MVVTADAAAAIDHLWTEPMRDGGVGRPPFEQAI
jgi:hypothetical protein